MPLTAEGGRVERLPREATDMSERIVELLIVLLVLAGSGGASRDVSPYPPSMDDVEEAALVSRNSDSDDSDSDGDPEVVRVDPDRGSAISFPEMLPEPEALRGRPTHGDRRLCGEVPQAQCRDIAYPADDPTSRQELSEKQD